MNVFDDHQYRTLLGERDDLIDEGLKRSLSPLLRQQFDCGITAVIRQRQQLGKQGGVCCWRKTPGQQGIKLVELGRCIVIVREARSSFQLTDDRVQRTVGVLRGAEVAKPRMRFGRKVLGKGGYQSRLANSWLTRQQYDLSFSCYRLRPAPQSADQVLLAAQQAPLPQWRGKHRNGCPRILLSTPPKLSRPRDALQVPPAQVLKLKEIAKELARAVGDNDRARVRNALQPCSKVWCLANNRLLLRSARANHVAYDHQTGGYSDACLKRLRRLEVP